MKHITTIHAPAETVQSIISEAENWPIFFAPTIACEQKCSDQEDELSLWAREGELDSVVCWRSVRQFSVDGCHITFRQVEPVPPLTEMAGTWTVHKLDERTTELTLSHTLAAADEDALCSARAATDYNSTAELAGIKTLAETYGSVLSEHIVRTHDEVWIDAPVHDVFTPLWDVSRWPDLLTHVDAVTVHSRGKNQHRFSMTLGSTANHVHTVESVRIAHPDQWVAFKQIKTPAGVYGHAGTWTLEESDGRTCVTVRHLALLERNEDVPLQDLVTRLRSNLSRSSLSTLTAIERLAASEAKS